MRRRQPCLFAVIALVIVLSTAASAQLIDTRPDAGVCGNGVVVFGSNTGNYAEFVINVDKFGPNFSGGFRWVEYTGLSLRPIVIQTRQIVGMRFLADNHVVVEAFGLLGDKPAKIAFELLDDLNMDAVKIRAQTLATTSISPIVTYEKGGGLAKGNIVVFRKPEISTAFGNGAIKVKDNIGVFDFKASSSPQGLFGSLIYQEINPASPATRPVMRIELRTLLGFRVDGNKAVLEGTGMMNGVPAKIRVLVADNVKPSPVLTDAADAFAIQAVPAVATFAPAEYSATGPLIRGDIAVNRFIPVPIQ